MQLNSYPKVYNLGHKYLSNLFLGEVVVQEKVDGSQFSFGVKDGVLYCSSHHQNLNLDSAGMFQQAVDYVKSIRDKLIEGWTYRGEYLQKPVHNCLHYDRVPKHNIILFDIDAGLESYMAYSYVEDTAAYLDLEIVPQFFLVNQHNTNISLELFKALLDRKSILGGTTIEGVVIKNYNQFGIDGHCLMGKFVSEKFKEMNKTTQRANNPTQGDIILQLATELHTEARWNKAIQHLNEQGLLKNEPADIGRLLKEIQIDIEAEEKEYIKERLYTQARKTILKKAIAGFPEWYKELLLKKQFSS